MSVLPRCAFVAALFLVNLALAADPLDNWSLRSSGTTNDLNGVTFGSGTFVAVGGNLSDSNATILTSTDLLDWLPLSNLLTDGNGTAQFNDLTSTNFTRRFYRAVLPWPPRS